MCVEFRIVEGATEEDDGVVTASAETRCLHVAVSLQGHPSSLPNAEQIGGVVERGKAMDAVTPALVIVGVTLLAIARVVENSGGNELAGRRTSQGREEVLFPGGRSLDVPLPRILQLEDQQTASEDDRDRGPAQTDLPANPTARQSVENEEPGGYQRTEHVNPIGKGTYGRIVDYDQTFNSGQQNSRAEEQERGRENIGLYWHFVDLVWIFLFPLLYLF